MAQDTTPAIIVYQGDGSNNVFSVPFDKGYYGEVKVLFVRRGLADYIYYPSEDNYTVSGRLYAWKFGDAKVYTHTPNPAVGAHTYNSRDVQQANDVSAIAGQTITVGGLVYTRAAQNDIESSLLLTWTGDTLQIGDFICIIRETERGQPYEMPNNQKHIEMALDNLERQIQEVKDATDSALIVDPSYDIPNSHKMNPVNWMKSIIRCMDFSVRALRYSNDWLDYSLDDPNIADGNKTWHHLLNTENIKTIKERREIVDGVEHYWVEYLTFDNQWRKLVDSEWDGRIEEAERIANEAHDIAEEALGVSTNADTKADAAITYATAAQQAVAGIACRKYIFTLTEGQSTVVIDEEAEAKNIDLYLNGQLLIPTGNWTISGDTISLLFGPEADDVIVVIVGTIRQVAEMISIDAHNADPLAHAILFNHIDCGVL